MSVESLLTELSEVDPDCIPETYPCWQHYGDFRNAQPVTKWVLDLATSLVSFRIRALVIDQSDEAYEKINDATWMLRSLINTRWCACVQQPFNFAPGEGTYQEVPEREIAAGRSLLAQLGLLKPEEPFERRV